MEFFYVLSIHTTTKSSWKGFLINMSVTVWLVFLLVPGVVMSVSISITSLSHWPSVHHLSCSLWWKPPLHDFVYH
jgi:hypothetical protein